MLHSHFSQHAISRHRCRHSHFITGKTTRMASALISKNRSYWKPQLRGSLFSSGCFQESTRERKLYEPLEMPEALTMHPMPCRNFRLSVTYTDNRGTHSHETLLLHLNSWHEQVYAFLFRTKVNGNYPSNPFIWCFWVESGWEVESLGMSPFSSLLSLPWVCPHWKRDQRSPP